MIHQDPFHDMFDFLFKNDAKTTAMFRNAVFASSADKIFLGEGEENAKLMLTSPILNGLQLIKIFELTHDNYILNYRSNLISI